MKRFALTVALLCSACPGTLEEADFVRAPSPTNEEDASTWARDAAAVTGMDASANNDAASERDARMSSSSDAEAAPGDAQAGVADAAGPARADAGASCNFRALAQMRCGSASCHGSGGAAAGLDLASDGLAARIAGRKASGACSDALLVDPDQPEQSVLYRRVTGSACGVQMPLGGVLRSDEQACFLSWIEGL